MIAGIDFELVRILLAAGMLAGAAFLDIRRREVSDLLWVVFGILALAVYALEFANGRTFDLMTTIVPISIAAAASFGIYKSGLFGGADALALVTLAVILPVFGGGLIEQIMPATGELLLHPVAPLIVLSNGIILSLSQIGLNLANNAMYASKNPGMLFEGLEHESLSRKILAAAIGYRTDSKPAFSFPIEEVVDGRRQFSFAFGPAETAEYESRRNVWVTPGTPFLVFMLAGFMVMLVIGDISAMALSGLTPFFG